MVNRLMNLNPTVLWHGGRTLQGSQKSLSRAEAEDGGSEQNQSHIGEVIVEQQKLDQLVPCGVCPAFV
jgi:hypothetical protein